MVTADASGVATASTSISDELGRLARLAWPVALAQLGSMMLGVVDVLMVGRLGEGALASVALGHTYSFALWLPALGLALGLDPVFAQSFGGRRPGRATSALVYGAVILALLSLPMIALHLFAEPVLLALQQPPEVVQEAAPYTRIRALAVLPFVLFALFRQYLQGAGRMWPGTFAIVIGNGVNVVANAVLVFGLLGLPALGVNGAAWATVLSTVAMAATLGIVLLRDRPAPMEREASTPSAVWALLLVAAPVAFQVGLEGWGFSVATVLVGMFGKTWLAGHSVAMTLASLAFMVPLGIGSAAATRVGNLLGAGQSWGRAAWLSIAMAVGVMAVFASVFAGMPRWVAWPFVDSAGAIDAAAILLPIAAGFALFDGAQVVTFGVLRGAGDTTVPAIANIVGYYVIGLPTGAALAFVAGLGAMGVWLGLALALACVAILLFARLVMTWRRGGYRV